MIYHFTLNPYSYMLHRKQERISIHLLKRKNGIFILHTHELKTMHTGRLPFGSSDRALSTIIGAVTIKDNTIQTVETSTSE